MNKNACAWLSIIANIESAIIWLGHWWMVAANLIFVVFNVMTLTARV